jgi:putrescine aminotransferase
MSEPTTSEAVPGTLTAPSSAVPDEDAYFADVVDKYRQHVNPYLAEVLAYAGFGVEVYGEGCYIEDHRGRRYLDCLGGYGTFALGHRHPRVVSAVKDQLDSLGMSGKAFFGKPAADLAAELANIAPAGLQYTFFSNSGAEAVEGALKFAKVATGRSRIISTVGAYHGKTLGALATTGREKYRTPVEPLMPGVEFIPFGDTAAAVAAIDDQTAAFIVEPIQGEGGIHVPPDGYLRAIREACDRSGALMIADEVQTCIGRTGAMFGCDHEGVAPDLMTLAKQLGGGVMPIGATMGTASVWEKVFAENPLMHTSTFGGNPMACAAGLAAVRVVQEEDLVARSRDRGALMMELLQEVQARHPDLVSDVRGKGLMIGVEFATEAVSESTAMQVLERGMCVAYTLNNPRVIRLEPPLIISEGDVRKAVEILDGSLTESRRLLAMPASLA